MRRVPNPKEQNEELLRLITANKERLVKLQRTIADLQLRTEATGEMAHIWDKAPAPSNSPEPIARKKEDSTVT